MDARIERDPLGRLMRELEDALCLGVTVLTGDPIVDALATSRAVKERFPRLPIVWGGWHPSLFPWECLQEPAVDLVVRAQGEETFPEIVARLAQGEELEGVLGRGFKRDDKPILFYVRFAYRPTRSPLRWPLHTLARWRCERDFYRFPVEKRLVEWVRPPQKLS